MTPSLPLNTSRAHIWAAVVFGTAWKRHTLDNDGALTAEYTRGPLILWATQPGENEGLQADGLAVSVLDDRINRLNTVQVFERFKWAARGKVRHSVRWKTGKRPRRRLKLEVLADLRFSVRMAERRAAGVEGSCVHFPARTAKNRRASIREWKAEKFEDRLRDIAPACANEDNPQGIDFELLVTSQTLPRLLKHTKIQFVFEGSIQQKNSMKRQLLLPHLSYHLITRNKKAIKLIFETIYSERLTFALLLKHLEQAAFRAHLARRVKPAPRGHRIRRPLYARPRPPSAPLAPPVI